MELSKISIITPALNAEATIKQTILSVANQRYKEIEHLIIDGCSKDSTISIIKDYQKLYGHIVLIQEKDAGIYDAMNKGIKLCKGDWLYFLGADDELFDENVLSDLHSLAAFSQDRVFFGNVYIQGDNLWAKDKTIYDGPFDLKKLIQKNICQQSIFYPKHIIKQNGYFNIDYEVTADWDYNLRCFANQEFLYVDKTIAVFKSGGKSSQSKTGISFKEFSKNIIHYFNLDINDPKYYNSGSPFHNLLSHYKHISKTEINPFSDSIDNGISLFTAVKNRKDIFEEALKTWVNHKQIDEIIIVDWSSDEDLMPIINKYQNGKIFLARVKDQEKWVLSHAFNLAARLTTQNKILKIDSDVKILPDFFEEHSLQAGKFFTGNWGKARNENETHLNGNIFIYREDFFRINGYNEFLKTYGWDDTDLFSRLESTGLERLTFNFDTLHHIEHQGRMDFQSPSNKLNNLTDEEWSRINIFINRYITSKLDHWNSQHHFLNFNIAIVNNTTIECNQIGEDLNKIPDELLVNAENIAVEERLVELGLEIPKELQSQVDDKAIFEYYNLYLGKNISDTNHHLFNLITVLKNSYNNVTQQKAKDLNRLTLELSAKDELLIERDIQIQSLQKQIDEISTSHHNITQQREKDVNRLGLELIAKNEDLQSKKKTIIDTNKLLHDNEQVIKSRDIQIQSLQKQINDIHASKSWRFGNFISSLIPSSLHFSSISNKKNNP